MSVNHALEAKKYLSQASWFTSDTPDGELSPETVGVLAQLANAHASLAHLPEQQAIALEQLAKAQHKFAEVKRTVGAAIADGLLSGDRTRHATVWYLANAIDKAGIDIEPAIRDAVEARGKDFEQAWKHPNTGLTDPRSPQGKVERTQLVTVLGVLVDELISMATSFEAPVRERAFRLMTALDGAGVNIDERVDARSRELGHGPHLYAAFGQDYDLTKQWVDRRGKWWEHTGSWSDVGGPVMRLDEPDGEHLVLGELVREYGPLHTGTPAPKSPERPSRDPWGDEPPF